VAGLVNQKGRDEIGVNAGAGFRPVLIRASCGKNGLLGGAVFVPEGRSRRDDRVGRSFRACLGQANGVRPVGTPERARSTPASPRSSGDPGPSLAWTSGHPPFTPSAFKRPDGTHAFSKGFQGLKSLAKIGQPSGMKAIPEKCG
jgi:hypothetical protein